MLKQNSIILKLLKFLYTFFAINFSFFFSIVLIHKINYNFCLNLSRDLLLAGYVIFTIIFSILIIVSLHRIKIKAKHHFFMWTIIFIAGMGLFSYTLISYKFVDWTYLDNNKYSYALKESIFEWNKSADAFSLDPNTRIWQIVGELPDGITKGTLSLGMTQPEKVCFKDGKPTIGDGVRLLFIFFDKKQNQKTIYDLASVRTEPIGKRWHNLTLKIPKWAQAIKIVSQSRENKDNDLTFITMDEYKIFYFRYITKIVLSYLPYVFIFSLVIFLIVNSFLFLFKKKSHVEK